MEARGEAGTGHAGLVGQGHECPGLYRVAVHGRECLGQARIGQAREHAAGGEARLQTVPQQLDHQQFAEAVDRGLRPHLLMERLVRDQSQDGGGTLEFVERDLHHRGQRVADRVVVVAAAKLHRGA